MENKGLLFIPDISGFTKFVSETEIDHSRLIIQELLEILIDANQTGLEISEIEGDAILFYKFGEPPSLQELYKQVESMFCAFHHNLNIYQLRKYCQCKACISAISLTLKIVTHYGEFTGYNVKNFSKLIGKDVIIAHQLLKNDIENHEYWLITQNLLGDKNPEDFEVWMKWYNGDKQTETGSISFQYTWLSQLKNKLPPESVPQLDLSDYTKLVSVSREYETDIITLFHAAGDFNYRSKWMEGVIQAEELSHFLPRIGMQCRCVMDNGQVSTYTSNHYIYNPDKIEFSEVDDKSKNVTYFTVEKISDAKAKLTIDLYVTQSLTTTFLFRFTKQNKITDKFKRSLENLADVLKEIGFESGGAGQSSNANPLPV